MTWNRIWISALAIGFCLPLAPMASANEWAEVPPGGQPWAEADPNAPAVEVLQPLHRRLPKFHLNHSISYTPEPLLLRSKTDGSDCGQKLPALVGSVLDFDFRFWYLFVGTRLTFTSNEDESIDFSGYALRGGAYIPFGERFAVIHAFWIGGMHLDAYSYDFDDAFSDMDSSTSGLQLGTSLGFRVMLTSWLGLTADAGISTTLLDSGSVTVMRQSASAETVGGGTSTASGDVRLNAVSLQTGLVFAW
jgi:hypothetical protein